MDFEIDVSGEDILSKDYTICIACEGTIKGFKMPSNHIRILASKFGQHLYRYKKSKKGRSDFKVRAYSIIIYHLFRSLKIDNSISLSICRDFNGKEEEIKSNLHHFLDKLLGLKIDSINFCKLTRDSIAHEYSYLMRKDIKNKMNTYVKIRLEDIEKFLRR